MAVDVNIEEELKQSMGDTLSGLSQEESKLTTDLETTEPIPGGLWVGTDINTGEPITPSIINPQFAQSVAVTNVMTDALDMQQSYPSVSPIGPSAETVASLGAYTSEGPISFSSDVAAENLMNYFHGAEGAAGGDSVTSVKTLPYGLTRAKTKRQPGESYRSWAKRELQEVYLKPLEQFQTYRDAPMGVKIMLGSWAWNAGTGRPLKALAEVEKYRGDPLMYQQKMKEMIFQRLEKYPTARVAKRGNRRHVISGLGVRVAKDYNFAAKSMGMPTIDHVQYETVGNGTRIKYLDKNNQLVHESFFKLPYYGGGKSYKVRQYSML